MNFGGKEVKYDKIYDCNLCDKKRFVALIPCIAGGFLGVHQFYVGRIGKGLLYAFTLGLVGVGIMTDFFSILFGSFRDNVNAPLREW